MPIRCIILITSHKNGWLPISNPSGVAPKLVKNQNFVFYPSPVTTL